jgi:predicted SAM-dependent methyltransferase
MIKINMGCGWRNFGKDWIHIDGGDYRHLDYTSIVDLRQFQDDSVDLIYASHVIEYFDREEVKVLLTEWKRILKKNAILRIAVPDFEAIVNLYLNGKYPLEKFLGPLYGKMIMSENNIYHKTVYDLNSIKKLMLDIGFSKVKKYDWRNTEHSKFDDHSQAYLPHMDKDNGVLISLNVECTK